MSESKARLQRENEELRKTKALFELLLEAARVAEHELCSSTAPDPAKAALDVLEAALAKMPPPEPRKEEQRPPSFGFQGRRFAMIAAGLASVDVVPLGAFDRPHSGLPHGGRR